MQNRIAKIAILTVIRAGLCIAAIYPAFADQPAATPVAIAQPPAAEQPAQAAAPVVKALPEPVGDEATHDQRIGLN
jgi:hypothetical protein